ncbi:MAG: cell division protein ZapA [Acidobacteria bacterium]|nr:cell division protein ZapA [Acidobacteriota bacterium]
MGSGVIHVEIHGQRYAVRSDLDPQYVAELAAYLDEKMRAAARELTSAEALRVAVIAGLNICDELFRARADSAGQATRVRARAAEIERLLDAVLENSPMTVVNE